MSDSSMTRAQKIAAAFGAPAPNVRKQSDQGGQNTRYKKENIKQVTKQTRQLQNQTQPLNQSTQKVVVPQHAYRMGNESYRPQNSQQQRFFGNRGRSTERRNGGASRRNGNSRGRDQQRRPQRTDQAWITPRNQEDHGLGEEETLVTDPDEDQFQERRYFKVDAAQKLYTYDVPQDREESYGIEFKYISEEGAITRGDVYISFKPEYQNGGASNVEIRDNLSNQNVLMKSYQHNSPPTRHHPILDDRFRIVKNVFGIENWAEYYCSENGFFTTWRNKNGEEQGIFKDPKLAPIIIPNSPIFPEEWQGKPWKNQLLLNVGKETFRETLNYLNIRLEQGSICGVETVYYYSGSELEEEDGTEGTIKKWDVDGDANLSGTDIVICGVTFNNNWAFLAVLYFGAGMFSKAEVGRHFMNAQQFVAAYINQKTFDGNQTSEWAPYLNIERLQAVVYKMLNFGMTIIRECSHFVSIQEQIKIRRIGVISLTELMGPNTELMRNLAFPTAQIKLTYQRHCNGYGNRFLPMRANDRRGFHDAWRLINQQEEIWSGEPLKMKDQCESITKNMAEMALTGEIGFTTGSSIAILNNIDRQKLKTMDKAVDRNTNPQYLDKIKGKKSYQEHHAEMTLNTPKAQTLIQQAIDERLGELNKLLQATQKKMELQDEKIKQQNEALKQLQIENRAKALEIEKLGKRQAEDMDIGSPFQPSIRTLRSPSKEPPRKKPTQPTGTTITSLTQITTDPQNFASQSKDNSGKV
ncbi:unnamed protein product [Oikopleura dioica]|uniref:Uncharacterized protein n=1 Tax=Oikopleura dioica TaxID=34765 RepID=E4XI53_OIKDI|nr:unnamed protein product [Oikopleura dioica]